MSENAPADGHTGDLPNGHTDGLPNGLPNGHTDDLPNGLSNGNVDMTVNGAASANSEAGPGEGPLPIPTIDDDPNEGFPAIDMIRGDGGLLECVMYAEHLLELLPQGAAAAADSDAGTAELEELRFNLHACLARVQTLAQELDGQIETALN